MSPNRSTSRTIKRKCLIVERHEWETGSNQRQLQFVLETAHNFFGRGNIDRIVTMRLFIPSDASSPAITHPITISRVYSNQTRRTNGFPEMSVIPAAFVFFEETNNPNTYDVWWQTDKAYVATRYTGWSQGKNTQYGRGRLSIIVDAPDHGN